MIETATLVRMAPWLTSGIFLWSITCGLLGGRSLTLSTALHTWKCSSPPSRLSVKLCAHIITPTVAAFQVAVLFRKCPAPSPLHTPPHPTLPTLLFTLQLYPLSPHPFTVSCTFLSCPEHKARLCTHILREGKGSPPGQCQQLNMSCARHVCSCSVFAAVL